MAAESWLSGALLDERLTDYFSTHGSVLGCCARIEGMGTTTESSSEPSSSLLSPSRSVASDLGTAEEVVSNCFRNISKQRQQQQGDKYHASGGNSAARQCKAQDKREGVSSAGYEEWG